ncbi:MAG TPA: aminotransferase class III-fold pyridoxal phosphate-dependent enzyme, partial [Dermatophilaceae bacterium]|nr:aminotransferase class III-fold pyridoxal phosphate-dependent enzyme [Dermatophilaceae bacterium]
TFGGNPFAAAIGGEVVAMLATGEFQERAAWLGEILAAELRELTDHGVLEVRSRGLWAGLDIDPGLMSGKELCYRMADRGVLAKDTHGSTIRLAPPIVASEDDVRLIARSIRESLAAGA